MVMGLDQLAHLIDSRPRPWFAVLPAPCEIDASDELGDLLVRQATAALQHLSRLLGDRFPTVPPAQVRQDRDARRHAHWLSNRLRAPGALRRSFLAHEAGNLRHDLIRAYRSIGSGVSGGSENNSLGT